MGHTGASEHPTKGVDNTDDHVDRNANKCLTDCCEDVVRVEPKKYFQM